MKVKCEYCGNFIPDTEEVCPVCGAPNEHMVRSGDGIPKTIEELKTFALSKNLPLAQMRFFIGEDIKEPKAFGIYEDVGGDFIVYKNKANGERAVRYRGSDEAYAVNELYQKLRAEVTDQKAKIASGEGKIKKQPSPKPPKKKTSKTLIAVVVAVMVLVTIGLLAVAAIAPPIPDNGYYLYKDNYYYTEDLGSTWYKYNAPADDWFVTKDVESDLNNNWESYKIGDLEKGSAETSTVYEYPTFGDYEYEETAPEKDAPSEENPQNNTEEDNWNDDWDDDDLDWDDDYDWDTDVTDWDDDW